jgi:hypothetical protein
MTPLLLAVPSGSGQQEGSQNENDIRFYIGLHQPSDAQHFDRCCIHVERLNTRRKPLGCKEILLDSQAFMKLKLHGCYPYPPQTYADKVHRVAGLVERLTAVTEDYMCEPFILAKTGLSVAEHQRLTIERYDELRRLIDSAIYLMPVLQGYRPLEYVDHLRQYGERLPAGAWVGVGSVCKRNGDPSQIRDVLYCIKRARPDLRLHGFGLKRTALSWHWIRTALYSADSLAWSLNARKNGRNANDWREANRYAQRVDGRYLGDLPLFREAI